MPKLHCNDLKPGKLPGPALIDYFKEIRMSAAFAGSSRKAWDRDSTVFPSLGKIQYEKIQRSMLLAVTHLISP